MLTLSDQRRIFLARESVDMRKGIPGLSALVEHAFQADPYAGDVFVFVGRNRQRVKVLVWERSGFWLCVKRLEQGSFAVPKGTLTGTSVTLRLSQAELQLLLEGIDVHRATYHGHYHRDTPAPTPIAAPGPAATNQANAR